MKPEKLILSGIYSYRNETVIDFTTLCRAELFGIFGHVGSGKSAVIEAITYVLYGRIERLSSRVYYNMMNLRSDRMRIDFTFGHRGERYRFTFDVKRNKNSFDKIGTPERGGYIEKAGEWVPLFDRDSSVTAEDIIGLSYDNFRRTVIVPQGRFQEFLHLEKGKRTEMLMELFQLDRFDLYSKTASLGGDTAAKIASVSALLGSLEGVSGEVRRETGEKLAHIAGEVERLSSEAEKSGERLAGLKELGRLHGELSAVAGRMALKEAESGEMNARRGALELYERCRELFGADMSSLRAAEEDFGRAENALSSVSQSFQAAGSAFDAAELEHEGISCEYAGIGELKSRAQWCGLLGELRKDEEEEKDLTARLDAERAELSSLSEKSGGCSAELEEARAGLERLDTGGLSADLMRELSSRYTELRKNAESLEAEKAARDSLGRRLQELGSGAGNIPALTALRDAGRITDFPASPPGAEELLAGLEEEAAEAERLLRSSLIAAGIDAEIRKIAGSLESGRPCPVCGSIEHPAPAASAAVDNAGLKRREEELSGERALLSEFRDGLSALKQQEAAVVSQLEASELRIGELQAERAVLLDGFPEAPFGPEEYEAFLEAWKESTEADEKRRHLMQIITSLGREAESTGNAIREKEAAISGLNIRLAAVSASAEGRRERIDPGFLEEFAAAGGADPSLEMRRLQAEAERIGKAYTESSERLRTRGLELERSRTELEMRKERREETLDLMRQTEERLLKAVESSDFSGIDEVSGILSRKIDVGSERKAVEDFARELERLRTESLRLEAAVAGRSWEPAMLSDAENEYRKTRAMLGSASEEAGRLRALVAELDKQLQQKKELEAELGGLEKRAENIRTLLNLFKGKKFIDYVSTVYLHELCRAANARFRKLTRESLRLELDESNNFIIRDYLNEGKTRSVKTLSGGQTFQAAFSLSLALADSIGRERSGFFFLDEGFGSLDRESLGLVFDSLKSLKKEQRTVGIISHVEELKQEIDTFITVRNETEEGSIVSSSWL